MKERRYTLSEIDRMRKALSDIANNNGYYPSMYDFEDRQPYATFHFLTIDYEEQRRVVEDQLRTYLMGGVAPTELEDKAKIADDDCKKRIADYEHEKTERRLTKEYGPRQ